MLSIQYSREGIDMKLFSFDIDAYWTVHRRNHLMWYSEPDHCHYFFICRKRIKLYFIIVNCKLFFTSYWNSFHIYI
jgi:hypothetical protein